MILVILFQSCSSSNLDDFNPDRMVPPSEARLEFYADTTQLNPILASFSTKKRLDSLLYYAEWLKNNDKDIALFYAQRAYDLATDQNWNFPRAISAYRIASLKGRKAKFGEDIEDAIVDARISERLLKAFDRPDWTIRINSLIGQLLKRKGDWRTARQLFEETLDDLEKNPKLDSTFVKEQNAFLLHDLVLTLNARDTAQILHLFSKSDSLYQLIKNEEDRARLWLDWATYYLFYKDYSRADSLHRLCLKYGEKKDRDMLAIAYREIGNFFSEKYADYSTRIYLDSALYFLNKCLTFKSTPHYRTYEIIGNVFQNAWVNNVRESYADSAIQYYKKSIINASQEGVIKKMRVVSSNLVFLCNYKDGIYEDALKEEVYVFLDDSYSSLVDTITEHSKAAFQRINKVEQRDIQVQAKNKQRMLQYAGLGILGIAGLIFLLLLQRQQTKRIKAEMDSLRAQINPHFISNSLNAIEGLVNLGNTKAAAKYLVHFSRLSRQILNGSRASTTSLAGELKTLKHFLALEQLRFRDKLTFAIWVADHVSSEEVSVPAMILQPYVENAIWHGIKPKKEGGHVQVNVQREGKLLVCEVVDNGIGREKSRALRKASVMKHKSMGMQITEERLKALGRIKGSQVEIIDLKDDTGEACGTKVVIRFPYQLKKG